MRIALVVLLGFGACGPADKGADGAQGDPGPAGAMGAQGSAGTTGQDVVEALGTGQLQITATTNFSVIPGLTVTTTVPQNAKLHVDTDGGIQCTGTGTAYSVVDIAVFVDGSITAQRRIVAANTTGVAQMLATWAFGRTFSLGAGTHTIDVRAAGVDPAAAIANVSSASAAQLQAVLTVTTLKM